MRATCWWEVNGYRCAPPILRIDCSKGVPAFAPLTHPARSARFVQPDQADATCPVLSAKINPLPRTPNQIQPSRRSVPVRRGVSRSSRTLGAGCDGRGNVDMTNDIAADGEVVWFWHLDADAKLRGTVRVTTVTKSPITGKSAKESVKTIVQGRPDVLGVPVVTKLACFFISHARLRVRLAPGFPCALRSRKANRPCMARALSAPREFSRMSPRST